MDVNVTLIGLDRIGTSFGLALKRYQARPESRHSFTILGSDTTNEPMKIAQKLGAIDNFHRDKVKAAESADLIITHLPYGETEGLFARIGPALKSGAVVLDLSLLKQTALQWADEFFPKNEAGRPLAYLVGLTPMVGVHALYSGGVEAEDARADLFDGADMLIAPDARCPAEAVQLAEDIARLIGGTPRFIDPAEHDGLIAATEDLPALLGAALFYTLAQSEGWPELQRMVNPTLALAFQSLRTRSQADALALLTHNRANVVRHLDNLLEQLEQVRGALAAGAATHNGELDAFLQVVYGAWQKWDARRTSGTWDDAAKPDPLPGAFSAMGGMLFGRRPKKSDDEDTD